MSNNDHTENNETCTGKSIRAAIHMFSYDLLRGCNELADKARTTSADEDVRVFNAACAFFATSAIEAKVNEGT